MCFNIVLEHGPFVDHWITYIFNIVIFHSKLLNHQRVDSSCLRVLDEGVCSKISNIANISPSGDADFFFWASTTKINNFEITDLHMLHPCVPSNPGNRFWLKKIGNEFPLVYTCPATEKSFSWGWVHSNIYVRQTLWKKWPIIFWGGMVFYMTLQGWEQGF